VRWTLADVRAPVQKFGDRAHPHYLNTTLRPIFFLHLSHTSICLLPPERSFIHVPSSVPPGHIFTKSNCWCDQSFNLNFARVEILKVFFIIFILVDSRFVIVFLVLPFRPHKNGQFGCFNSVFHRVIELFLFVDYRFLKFRSIFNREREKTFSNKNRLLGGYNISKKNLSGVPACCLEHLDLLLACTSWEIHQV
jgi:hypothetical protein